jgi:hypothetical protein
MLWSFLLEHIWWYSNISGDILILSYHIYWYLDILYHISKYPTNFFQGWALTRDTLQTWWSNIGSRRGSRSTKGLRRPKRANKRWFTQLLERTLSQSFWYESTAAKWIASLHQGRCQVMAISLETFSRSGILRCLSFNFMLFRVNMFSYFSTP